MQRTSARRWPEAAPAAGPQAQRMVREADLNGDGKVSREEFMSLLGASSVPDSLDQYDPRLGRTSIDAKA